MTLVEMSPPKPFLIYRGAAALHKGGRGAGKEEAAGVIDALLQRHELGALLPTAHVVE